MQTLSFLKIFYQALGEHRQVEADIRARLRVTLDPVYLRPAPGQAEDAGFLKYARRHFFSTLFLTIYQSLGIEPARRHFYGRVNHCIRGLVTATDNLLDAEYKEMLPLAFPDRAFRFKSVMHILLFDRFLARICDEAEESGVIRAGASRLVQDEVFRALVPVGAEEALEEEGVREVLTPEAIMDSVHLYKGGRLLCLSFVAPRFLETDFPEAVSRAEAGIFSIGLALQVIDDLTDVAQDLAQANHNYLVSWVWHRGLEEERRILASLRSTPDSLIAMRPLEEIFPASVRIVMRAAIGEALHGFSLLHDSGLPLPPRQALLLVRLLFRLRGVQRLLPFFPTQAEARTARLSHA